MAEQTKGRISVVIPAGCARRIAGFVGESSLKMRLYWSGRVVVAEAFAGEGEEGDEGTLESRRKG
jgi:hypothetical protein